MKTNHVPAIVMLVAGALYCVFGIREKVELWDFTIQLLVVLLVFYVLGGIIKMVLDRFMGDVQVKTESKEGEEAPEEDVEEVKTESKEGASDASEEEET